MYEALSKPMSSHASPPFSSSPDELVSEPAEAARSAEASRTLAVDRQALRATGKWWFAFDRWLPAVPAPDDDFVLA